MKIRHSLEELIGGTPLLELHRIEARYGLACKLIAKLESFNPLGSVKDRAAWWMLETAEREGKIKPGSTVIEPTSGNTGIGLAWVCSTKGYRLILTMPESMSMERRMLLTALGAELVLTPAATGMRGAIAKAEELLGSLPDGFMPMQFANPANAEAHFLTTGPEIWEDTGGAVDLFVSGIGTGGTVTGTGSFLKEKNPAILVIGVEPVSSPVLSGGQPGPHRIQGIGAGFVPAVLDVNILDEVITVADENSFTITRELARQEGVFCGISSGAALCAAIQVGKRPENAGKTIVVILPDTGDRYLSLLQDI